MDSQQINHALKSRHDLPSHIFKGTFALNQLPCTLIPPFGLVFNSEPLPSEGQHWMAIFCPAKGVVEYFDTSGSPPLEAESLKNLEQSVSNGQGCRLIYSLKQIQSECSSVCGEFCVLFLYCRMKGVLLSDFVDLFSSSALIENDVFVYSLVHSVFNIPNRDRPYPVLDEACIQSSRDLKSFFSHQSRSDCPRGRT